MPVILAILFSELLIFPKGEIKSFWNLIKGFRNIK